ncbi:hypothetical protein B0H11DRAFT_2373274 [Mycena galericulata]|nr:hypothetical protein B0H11DRAFT_2373274 [Mycena galericulata]
MDAKTILVNNSSLFSPTSSLPAFPSLLPVSSYHHSQTYSTLTATPLRVQQVVLVPRAYWRRAAIQPFGTPTRCPPHARCGLQVVSCLCDAHVRRAHPHSRERITHAPISLGYTREHNTICHRGHAKISGAILIPEPEHERRHRRRPRQLLPQHLRREAPPWCVGTRRSRSAGSDACGVMHMAIPTLVAVRDLRHAPQIPSRELDITYFPDSTVLTYPEVAPSRPFPINTVCRRVVSLVL